MWQKTVSVFLFSDIYLNRSVLIQTFCLVERHDDSITVCLHSSVSASQYFINKCSKDVLVSETDPC